MTLLPDNFFDEGPPRKNNNELAEAALLGRVNFAQWVQVGEPRFVAKDVSAWCSEVNLGQKVELGGTTERWEARGQFTGATSDDGRREFIKALRYMGPRTVPLGTTTLEYVVRVQARDDVDPEVLRQRLVEAGEDHLTSHGDVSTVTVQLLDLDTATGRQAYDHARHGEELEG